MMQQGDGTIECCILLPPIGPPSPRGPAAAYISCHVTLQGYGKSFSHVVVAYQSIVMNTRPCSLLLVLSLAGTLGSGQESDCKPEASPDRLKLCVQNILDMAEPALTQWEKQINGSEMKIAADYHDVTDDKYRIWVQRFRVDGSNTVTGNKLALQEVSNSSVTVRLSSFLPSLSASMRIIAPRNESSENLTALLKKMEVTFDTATSSLVTTWKIDCPRSADFSTDYRDLPTSSPITRFFYRKKSGGCVLSYVS